MSKKQRTYTAEFKAEAIKLIEANQGNVLETAKQQLKIAEMEREFLKKAVAYFVKESQ